MPSQGPVGWSQGFDPEIREWEIADWSLYPQVVVIPEKVEVFKDGLNSFMGLNLTSSRMEPSNQ